jgi:hypothetical protein
MTRITNIQGQRGSAKTGCLIAAIVIIVLVGGGGYLLWQKSMGMLNDQLIAAIKDDPALAEHIGVIDEVSLNLMATGEHPENQKKEKGGDDKDAFLVFDISGSKGSGKVLAKMNTEGKNESQIFQSATLHMGEGKKFPLMIHGKAPVVETPDAAPSEMPEAPKEGAPEAGDEGSKDGGSDDDGGK